MKRSDAEEIVGSTGWLAGRPAAFRETLLSHCGMVQFDRGATLYTAGDPPGGAYGLIEGSLRVEVPVAGHGPYVGYIAQPGFWVGVEAHMRREPRTITLTAGVPVTLFYLPLSAVESLAADPEAVRHFAVLIAENQDALLAATCDLFNPNLAARIASRLIAVAGWRDDIPATPSDPIPVTQTDLATICNVSRKTISEYTARLTEMGVLKQGYGSITINDPLRLKRIGEGVEPIEA